MCALGTYVKNEREKRGLSISSFSSHLRVSDKYLLAMEAGKRLPGRKKIGQIAKYLNIDEQVLLMHYYTDKWYQEIHQFAYAKEVMYNVDAMLNNNCKLNYTDIIDTIRNYLQSMPVECAWIFGSLARKQMHNASDIDLMVRYTHPKTIDLFDLSKYISDLEHLLNRKVDLVEEGFEANFAKENILKDRILIYERKATRQTKVASHN